MGCCCCKDSDPSPPPQHYPHNDMHPRFGPEEYKRRKKEKLKRISTGYPGKRRGRRRRKLAPEQNISWISKDGNQIDIFYNDNDPTTINRSI